MSDTERAPTPPTVSRAPPPTSRTHSHSHSHTHTRSPTPPAASTSPRPTGTGEHPDPEDPPTHAHPGCPSCGESPGEYVSLNDFNRMMSIVRLQVSVPISVLVSLGTMIICGAVIQPGLRGINVLFPTLLSPNSTLVAVYWGTLYVLQVGYCVLLIFAYSEGTKDAFIHGVGMRIAFANWLVAGWAVCWTLRMFKTAEVLTFINVILMISVNVTLLKYPASIMHPLRAVFIHGATTLFVCILFNLTWGHNGFVALKWVVKNEDLLNKWTWPAVGTVLGTNIVSVLWEIGTQQHLMAIANEYLLFCLLFSSVRVTPSIPESALPKPVPLVVAIIVCLVLHPIALVGGNVVALHKSRREGQIRLPDDDTEDRERDAEIEAEVQARIRARVAARNAGSGGGDSGGGGAAAAGGNGAGVGSHAQSAV